MPAVGPSGALAIRLAPTSDCDDLHRVLPINLPRDQRARFVRAICSANHARTAVRLIFAGHKLT
jgi:hypothetical protein